MSGVKGRSGGPRPNSGGARPGAGRPRTPVVTLEIGIFSDPLLWLLALMSDARQDLRLRAEAARALMPYFHAVQRKDRLGEIDSN